MKENRKLLKEVIEDIQRDLSDEEVLKLLAGSKISVNPSKDREKYTFGQKAAGALGFEDALRLVSLRAAAMQKACELEDGTMAAIIGLDAAYRWYRIRN